MGKNKNKIDYIPIPKICRYCGSPVVYTSNAEIYGKEYGNGRCYLCRSCRAFVGVHTGTNIPLGTLADDGTRKARNLAHNYFDKLWKQPTRIMTRYEAYKWLSRLMGLKLEMTHIGLFEKEQCKRVIEFVKEKLK